MRLLPIVVLSLAPLAHAVTSGAVIAVIKDVTTMSDQLRIEVQGITLFNAGKQGFKIAFGFSNIIRQIALSLPALSSAGPTKRQHPRDVSPAPAAIVPFPDAEAKLVVEALTAFVKVHQALLNVVIGKHGLLTLIPFFEPIRRILVALELIVDTLAFALIALIPTQAPSAETQFASLKITIKLATTTYS